MQGWHSMTAGCKGCHLIAKRLGLMIVLPEQAPILLQAAAIKAVLLPVA